VLAAMRILYTETSAFLPTSAHFLEALDALAARGGCEFRFFDEARYVAPYPSIPERLARRAFGRAVAGYRVINRALLDEARRFRPDLVLIGKGAYFAPTTLEEIKRTTGARLINWASDDPFNPASSSRAVLESIPLYDLYVCTKRAVMDDVARAGCPRVAYLRFGYKPAIHFPESAASAAERASFDCDVMFAGGGDSDRAPYFEELIRAIPGVRLNLFGGYWNRFPALRSYWRGSVRGREFRLAIGGAKIAVNLVRRSNRDDHVMRTFEVPACGGFMLAERTDAHAEIFAEDREAVFFNSPQEMAAQVRTWLARDEERRQIAQAGRLKVTCGRNTYADRLHDILELARTHAAQPHESESRGNSIS
jgi:spore maturation protein CgeB